MARETPEPGARGSDRPADLGAVLAALAPAAEGPLSADLERLIDALQAGGAGSARGPAARAIVAALVTAGAAGAELWARSGAPLGAWLRLAGAGSAVPDAERHVSGRHSGYPGTVAVVHAGGLALAFSGAHPGSDERERREDLAETLLALAVVFGAGAAEPPGDPGAPLRAA